MNKLVIYFLLLTNLFAIQTLNPTYVFTASGGVSDIVKYNDKLYIATQKSAVDIFDIKTKQLIKSITIPKIKDFMGDIIDAKIYNTDIFNGKVLFVAQHTSGFRELYIYKDNLKKQIASQDRLYISKAKFIDENNIIFSTLGNEMYLYDIKNSKIKWKMDVRDDDAEFNSSFADFALNEDKTLVVVADESGDLKLVDIKSAKVIDILAGNNLDKVFKVDIKNDKIITAGQDGRCVVYDMKNKKKYFLKKKKWFLIYGAALSPSGKYGAYSSDEINNVTVFNTLNKSEKYLLTNNLMTISSILFSNEDEIFVATDSNKFNYYKLK